MTATLKSSLLMLMHVSASKYSAADADASASDAAATVSVSACATDVAGRNVADHAAAVGLDTQIGEDRLRVNDRVVQRLRDASRPHVDLARFLPLLVALDDDSDKSHVRVSDRASMRRVIRCFRIAGIDAFSPKFWRVMHHLERLLLLSSTSGFLV